MDQVLWPVLGEQCPDSHYPSKGNWFLAHLYVVFDAKRVKHGCQQHIFSYETDVAISLNFGQSVIEGLGHAH